MTQPLTLNELKQAVASHAAAFRCVTEYQPMGGSGDKVFPPTYDGGEYATEQRILSDKDGKPLYVDEKGLPIPVPCVLLDSVQSQANRMELALLEAWRTKDPSGKRRIELPVITAKFQFDDSKYKSFAVTSLEAPHRIADAIFRDSKFNGVMFRKSDKGKVLDNAETRNARGLFEMCPTALVFGVWDSTGPRGGLGTKFQRALVSEIVGIYAEIGKKTSSKIDALGVTTDAGPLYERREQSDNAPEWVLNETLAKLEGRDQKVLFNRNKNDKGKPGNPSKANHSNVVPTIKKGGFTFLRAQQTTVLSLAVLRRLRFPINGAVEFDVNADQAAQTVLAALGLLSAALLKEEPADLRSRCQLIAQQEFIWELLDIPGQPPKTYILDGDSAVKLFNEAVKEAKALGLLWEDEILVEPSEDLLLLVKKSQDSNMHSTEGDQ